MLRFVKNERVGSICFSNTLKLLQNIPRDICVWVVFVLATLSNKLVFIYIDDDVWVVFVLATLSNSVLIERIERGVWVVFVLATLSNDTNCWIR